MSKIVAVNTLERNPSVPGTYMVAYDSAQLCDAIPMYWDGSEWFLNAVDPAKMRVGPGYPKYQNDYWFEDERFDAAEAISEQAQPCRARVKFPLRDVGPFRALLTE